MLTGPSALGMFVTSEGISQRPPLQWSENLTSVGYVHPYILAMNDEFITIHRYMCTCRRIKGNYCIAENVVMRECLEVILFCIPTVLMFVEMFANYMTSCPCFHL